MRFQRTNLIIALALFAVEVGIALFVHDAFIRPYVGDVLVVALLYYSLSSWLDVSRPLLLGATLSFAFCVEALQSVHFVEAAGLGDCHLARIVLGTAFSWGDLVAYTLGAGLVYLVEQCRQGEVHTTRRSRR